MTTETNQPAPPLEFGEDGNAVQGDEVIEVGTDEPS